MKKETKSTLDIRDLRASVGGKEILRGISLTIRTGSIHAIMGPNGGGKSTLANVLLGHPQFSVGKKSHIHLNRKDILSMPTEDRAKQGLFLAFQSPVVIPGVSVVNLLRIAYQSLYGARAGKGRNVQNPILARRWGGNSVNISDLMEHIRRQAKHLLMEESFLSRGLNDGFSGGEKKKMELLQALILKPKFAVFDEIDTGLDVDALKIVARGISRLAEKGTGVLVITHYQRILSYLRPDVIHVLVDGKIVETGNRDLARKIERTGYARYNKL